MKKTLSFALALAVCLGLTVSVFADGKPGDTTVTDTNGITYQLSNPIITIEPQVEINKAGVETCDVYIVPDGTTVIPLCPDGYILGEYSYVDANGDSIRFDNFNVMGIGNVGINEGITVETVDPADYGGSPDSRYYNGIFSFLPNGNQATLVFIAGNPDSTQPEQSTTPDVTVEDIPASGTAYASTQTVTVDGKAVEFQMYALKDANGNDTNYIKLRDLAYVLNGTAAQFSVGYDGTISLTTGEAYQAAGTEMTTPYSGDRAYTGGAQTVKLDGQDVSMTAITLTDDNGGGYTYFKLRDLGAALGFNVGWSQEAGVFVESDQPYAG